PVLAGDGHAPDQLGCWPTRRTARQPTAATYAVAGSPRPSPNQLIRSATAVTGAGPAGGRQRSTPRSTSAATPSNAASTCSNSTAPWPPALRNSPYATKPPSRSG